MIKLNLAPYQERVVEERFELDKKAQSLLTFLETDLFQSIDEEEQYRLHEQLEIMFEYSNILHERILAFR